MTPQAGLALAMHVRHCGVLTKYAAFLTFSTPRICNFLSNLFYFEFFRILLICILSYLPPPMATKSHTAGPGKRRGKAEALRRLFGSLKRGAIVKEDWRDAGDLRDEASFTAPATPLRGVRIGAPSYLSGAFEAPRGFSAALAPAMHVEAPRGKPREIFDM